MNTVDKVCLSPAATRAFIGLDGWPRPQPLLVERLLACAERLDGPESWVHLCITAAQEAVVAEDEGGSELPTRSAVAQALDHIRTMEIRKEKSWQVNLLVSLAEGYVKSSPATPGEGAPSAASIAYRANMPSITSRRTAQCFIACVAAGIVRGYITVKDANALLYAAQAALSAFPKRKPRKVNHSK
jgi:hypothetical protein